MSVFGGEDHYEPNSAHNDCDDEIEEALLNDEPHQIAKAQEDDRWLLGSSLPILRGIIWSLISAVGMAAQMILVEYIEKDVHPIQSLFIRTCFLLTFVLFISWKDSREYDWRDLLASLIFSISDNLGIGASYMAMAYLSAGDVVAILENTPVPASIIAWIFLGESFDCVDGVLAVVNGIGLVVISETQARSTEVSPIGPPIIGVILALFGLFCWSCTYNIVRWLSLRQREDPSFLSFMSGMTGLALTSTYLALTNSWSFPDNNRDIVLAVLMGLTTMWQFYAYLKAQKTINVLLVASILTLVIPITYGFEIAIMGQKVTWQTLIGVVLTTITSVLICLKHYFSARTEK